MHLGDSLIFSAIARLVKGPIPIGYDMILGPVAFAGWIGFFVTAMNLLPTAQLDGGHIAYSLFGRWHIVIARIVVLVLVGFGFLWPGWFIWSALIIGVGLKHPAPLDDITPISKKRKVIGILAFFILIITFVPVPFAIR
jgi:membrane-associated protease RseP (regulator of RpoE activity)